MKLTVIAVSAAAVAVAAAFSSAGGALYSRATADRANCDTLNTRTLDSNQHIRIPLRETARGLATILDESSRHKGKVHMLRAKQLSHLSVKEILRTAREDEIPNADVAQALAIKFNGYADEVKIVPPLNC